MKSKEVHEVLTDRQLVEAVAEWLHARRRIPAALLKDTLLTMRDNGTHSFTSKVTEYV